MKYIKQFFILLAIYLASEFLVIKLNLPLPSSVLGMIILLILLLVKAIKLDDIKDLSTFLTKNMAFFFVPALVNVINYIDILKDNLFKILIICMVSTITTFLATYFTVSLARKFLGGTK